MGFPKQKGGGIEKTGGESQTDAHDPAPALPEEVVSDLVFSKAQTELMKCMDATRPVWDKDSKSFRMEPDYPTRLGAIKLAYEYKIGRPIERRVELKLQGESWEDQRHRALKSPEGVRFLLAAGAISREEAEDALAKLAEQVKGASE